MSHILVVCTANICRSPVVEAIIQNRLHKRGYPDWTVSSAGTWAENGRKASRYSVEVLNERENLDISRHRSREVTKEMVRTADLILVMTANHAESLQIENRGASAKIYLLSQLVDDLKYDISDPYGQSKDEYVVMVRAVTNLVDEGLERIIQLGSREKDLF